MPSWKAILLQASPSLDLQAFPEKARIVPRQGTKGAPPSQLRAERQEARILYIHSGSFIFELSPLYWDFVLVLARKLGARVTVPVYPLAPEHKPAAMYDMLQPLYDKEWPPPKTICRS
ncbi:hypothetical protein MY11210_004837 [Beauveria gryllotalpidicola]